LAEFNYWKSLKGINLMTALGIMFRREYPPEHLPDFARQVETAGFDELWVIEDCFYAAGIAQAATALALTTDVQVGLGIMPAVARNAAFTALEIATLARIAPGRFLPGIGHGVGAWMKQIGAFPASQLGAIEDITTAVRAILRGGSVTMSRSYAKMDAVQLEYPLDIVPPVQLGVRGPKSLRLSGRVADGTILAEGCSPAYVRWAREQIAAGMKEANREEAHRVTVYLYWSMDADVSLAKARIRERLAANMASGIDVYLKPMGIVEQVAEMLEKGGEAYLREQMPDEWLHQMAAVGTVDKCVKTIRSLYEAGADSVVLVPMMSNEQALSGDAQAVIQAIAKT
jgi:5,10-methylenetetrahydromethanopterin reductase